MTLPHWSERKADLRALLDAGRFGVISDFDGTLSRIVPQPEAAILVEGACAALEALRDTLPLVALVSGRAVTDLRARAGVEGLVYVGNHGFERWEDGNNVPVPAVAQYRKAVNDAVTELRALDLPGTLIEDKGATLSAHYRNAAPADAARLRAGAQAAADRHGLRLYSGRMVDELRPPVTVDKGTSLLGLIADYELDAVLVLGDDTTDVDAMRAAREFGAAAHRSGVAVGVVTPESPPEVAAHSDVSASGPEDVSSLLAWLASTASASST